MDTLTLKECRTYLKKLQEICICLVCHGPLVSPDIAVCMSGHGVCRSCKICTQNCPLCQTKISCDKPVLLCQMVESLPRFCRFNYSCSYLIKENDNHESWCRYRIVKCMFCSTNVECHAILKHVSDCAKSSPLRYMNDIDAQRKPFLINSIHEFDVNVGVVKQLNGHIFNIHYLYSAPEKNLKVFVLFCPLSMIDNNHFKFNLEIWSTDNKVSLTFSQEVKIVANVKTDIFNIAHPILKTFHGKDVNFKTVISNLEVNNKSSTPSTAKKLKKN